ncbi:hypothetical protein [Clostridium estertheticum]|uniref:hypothetical protein n=1 Tax=Clostridium estertheticum TaxID=238834 RepID=UPI001CF45CFD|nr:hypothetical protein [Clostridium estertheticum]MCB2359435.1 hypothetical protein [Clostridium estertheticum]
MNFSNWATNNLLGQSIGPIFIADDTEISGIEVREQAGFGIIDVRFHFRKQNETTNDEIQVTGWLTNIPNENWVKSAFVPNDQLVIGLQVKEQAGFGIIDTRLIYKSKHENSMNIPFSEWITKNPNTGVIHDIVIPQGTQCLGLEGKVQAGFGLVDLRLIYNNI